MCRMMPNALALAPLVVCEVLQSRASVRRVAADGPSEALALAPLVVDEGTQSRASICHAAATLLTEILPLRVMQTGD